MRDNYKRGLGPTKQLSSSKRGTGKIFSHVRSGGGSRNFASEWVFPAKKKKRECHFPLQGIFLTQRSNPHLLHFLRLLHWQADPLPLVPPGKSDGLRAINNTAVETVTDFIFLGSKITAAMKLKGVAPWKKSYDQPRQHIKKQRLYFANKGPCSQSYCFSSSHVWMWELDYKESWATKNWCFWTVVLEKTLESPWTARRSNQSILKEMSPGCSLEGLMLKLTL